MLVQDVEVSQINVLDRRRGLKESAVASLAESLSEIGLLQPVTLNSDYTLIAGLHRVEAAKRLGWRTIAAHVKTMNELDAELAEIDENLKRNDLTALEQGEHLARRKEIYEAKHDKTKQGIAGATARWHATAESAVASFVKDTAQKTGASERAIYANQKIGRDIEPEVRDAIRSTELANKKTDLLEIARMEPEQQRQVAALVVDGKSGKEAIQAVKPHVSNNSGNNEWYTPAQYLEAAREVLDRIDLDPASCELANTHVQAASYFTAESDGLAQEWAGKVWMNPPYAAGLVERFISKLCEHYKAGDVKEAIVLVNNATETQWFQEAAASASAICFPRGRIKYLDATGKPANTPLQGQAFLYFGDYSTRFINAYGKFGFCVFV